jgi:hypothetical protein
VRVHIVAVAALSAALIAAATAPALATGAPAARQAGPNPGDASPSLSLSVSPAGQPEIASVGKNGSLWFSTKSAGKWHRTQVAKQGSVADGPSLIAENAGSAILAVQGPSHSLQYYYLVAGQWHHVQVAGKNTTYSTPSLGQGPDEPGIAVVGPSHSLVYYALKNGKWHGTAVNGKNTAYSAPSLVIRQASQAISGDPAGEVDIAVEGASNSLSYYRSLPGGHFQNDVIGIANSTYSAPSLIVLASLSRSLVFGVALIMVEGSRHSLMEYVDDGSWKSALREGNGWDYSAPSLVQGDTTTEFATAFEGASRGLVMTYYSVDERSWVNDVAGVINSVYSPPSLFVRTTSTPAGQLNIAVQGPSNRLRYYSAPLPAAGLGPNFFSINVAGTGTTYGG